MNSKGHTHAKHTHTLEMQLPFSQNLRAQLPTVCLFKPANFWARCVRQLLAEGCIDPATRSRVGCCAPTQSPLSCPLVSGRTPGRAFRRAAVRTCSSVPRALALRSCSLAALTFASACVDVTPLRAASARTFRRCTNLLAPPLHPCSEPQPCLRTSCTGRAGVTARASHASHVCSCFWRNRLLLQPSPPHTTQGSTADACLAAWLPHLLRRKQPLHICGQLPRSTAHTPEPRSPQTISQVGQRLPHHGRLSKV